jgi:uncharacterized protein YjiK
MLRTGAAFVVISVQARAQPVPFETCFGSSRQSEVWEIPGLREASGLTLTNDGRLLVHGDERPTITELSTQSGQILGTFQLGAKPRRADYEGIAVVDSTGYLVTSDGLLHEFAIPKSGQRSAVLEFTVIHTPIGRACEVEGITYDAPNRVLLIACKHMKPSSRTAIFRWSPEERRMATPDRIQLDDSAIPKGLPAGELTPSTIDVDPTSGDWVFISSPNQLMAVGGSDGRLRATSRISKKHRQPEGLAISADRTIYVADEGGKGNSTITIYACR